MSMHVPALLAPSIAGKADVDAIAVAAERRHGIIETLITAFVVVVVITLISAVGVALELG
jgi:hypothetical protein